MKKRLTKFHLKENQKPKPMFIVRLAGVMLIVLLSISSYAQSPLPFVINNNSIFNDASLYVAIVGEDLTGPPGAHIWVDCKTGSQFPMSPSFNTVQGPVYGGNTGPGGNAMYAACFTKLSDIPNKTVMLPPMQGCRVYISQGQQLYFYFFGATGSPSGYTAPNPTNPTDPNQGILYEMIELTYNQFGFFGNTTRVDSYKYPMGMELFGNNYYKKVGELKTHAEIGAAFKAFVPTEFQGCYNATTGEILAPSKTPDFADGSIGTMPDPGPYVDYFKPYIDQVWAKYANEDLIFDSGDAGIWQGRVQGEQLVMTAITGGYAGRKGIVARRPTTQETLEGKGVLDNVVQDATTDRLVEAQLCAALNRHVVDVSTPNVGQQNWSVASTYYKTAPANYYADFWHQPGICIDQLAYGFAYDDVWSYSSTVHTESPTKVVVAFGGYAGINNPPSVSITSPVNNASFTPPANITIAATATDADGTIAKVEFYNGSTLLGTDTSSPYSFTWSNVVAGTYTITARATDNGSASTTSTAVVVNVSSNNAAPTVSITSPSNNASFTAPASITVNATAADSDGTISKVEFYNGSVKIGEDTSSPYSFNWTNVSAGSYSLTAKAIDNLGATGTSAGVNVSVVSSNCSGVGPNAPGTSTPDFTWQATNTANPMITFIPGSPIAGSTLCIVYINGAGYTMDASGSNFTKTITAATGTLINMYFTYRVGNTGTERNSSAAPATFTVGQCGGSNNPPSASISSPANGTTFTAPASITINADASDADGSVSKVDFYNGTTLLGTDTSSPYSFSWTNVAAGTYSLTVKATDNASAVTTSSPVSITVNASNNPPSASITSPANGASFTAPASITISANASDTDGTITKVDFYNGTTLLGTDTSSPYSFSWTNVAAGTYSLTVKATDNANAVTTSAAVSVNVSSSGGGCSGSGPIASGQTVPDYTYQVSTTSGNVNWTFIPGAPIAGSTLCIIYVNGIGYTMTASGSNFVYSGAYANGQVLSFYFTYRVGNTGTERNSSATPHNYTVGTTCSGRMAEVTSHEDDYVVYPNPANSTLTIRGAKGASMRIINMQGAEISREVMQSDEKDVSSFAPGIYHIILMKNNVRAIKRFTKN